MTPPDDTPTAATEGPGAAGAAAAPPAPVAPAPARPGLESSIEILARDLLQERRTERRWRIFFRLAWLGVVLTVL